MRRQMWVCVALPAVLSLGLCACGATTTIAPRSSSPAPLSPSPVAAATLSFEADRYDIYPEVVAYLHPNRALYRTLYQAIEQLRPSVDIARFHASGAQRNAQTIALIGFASMYQLFYLRSVNFSVDGRTAYFTYWYDKAAAERGERAFATRVDFILTRVVQPGYSPLQKELAIYDYVCRHTVYGRPGAPVDTVDAYSVLTHGRGICVGYTFALDLLFRLAGLQTTVLSHADAHAWNAVRLGGHWYQCDATWDSQSHDLENFNMTDTERRENSGYRSWYAGNENIRTYPAPACTSTAFAGYRDVLRYSLDLPGGWIYYLSTADSSLHRMRLDCSQQSVIDPAWVRALRFWDGRLYYLTAAGDLDAFDPTTERSTTLATDVLVRVALDDNRIVIMDGKLIYQDAKTKAQVTLSLTTG